MRLDTKKQVSKSFSASLILSYVHTHLSTVNALMARSNRTENPSAAAAAAAVVAEALEEGVTVYAKEAASTTEPVRNCVRLGTVWRRGGRGEARRVDVRDTAGSRTKRGREGTKC
jgi:hypothetical protein